MITLTASGRAAFLAILLGVRAAETWEVRLTTRGGIADDGRAIEYPEPRGVSGYASQLLRPEDWTLYDDEAIARNLTWRLLPGPVPVEIFSAILVGFTSGVLYGIEAFEEPLTVVDAGLDLEIAPHLVLQTAKG